MLQFLNPVAQSGDGKGSGAKKLNQLVPVRQRSRDFLGLSLMSRPTPPQQVPVLLMKPPPRSLIQTLSQPIYPLTFLCPSSKSPLAKPFGPVHCVVGTCTRPWKHPDRAVFAHLDYQLRAP